MQKELELNGEILENSEKISIDFPEVEITFGKKTYDRAHVLSRYPDAKFLKQIHGHHILKEPKIQDAEADGQYATRECSDPLCIVTADCMPIFFFSNTIIGGVHAGWRGVAQRILPKALSLAFPNAPADKITIVIGPHIGVESFEIGEDVRNQIFASTASKKLSWFPTTVGKGRMDLLQVIQQQIEEWRQPETSLQNLVITRDTFQDLQFQSFRRDGPSSGRQISHIRWQKSLNFPPTKN